MIPDIIPAIEIKFITNKEMVKGMKYILQPSPLKSPRVAKPLPSWIQVQFINVYKKKELSLVVTNFSHSQKGEKNYIVEKLPF